MHGPRVLLAPYRIKPMLYRLYCSSGNSEGIPEYVGYSEIGDDGYWQRYVEIGANGTALRYDRAHSADSFGVLPEGQWDEAAASLTGYGTLTAISAELFDAVWRTTCCVNVGSQPSSDHGA